MRSFAPQFGQPETQIDFARSDAHPDHTAPQAVFGKAGIELSATVSSDDLIRAAVFNGEKFKEMNMTGKDKADPLRLGLRPGGTECEISGRNAGAL